MEKLTHTDLLDAGVHFGHLRKKWNPKMLPYIFMEKKGIHLIDLNKTIEASEAAAAALRSIARSGKKILFVATKKQAKAIVADAATRVNMPFVTERWLGGMLTNFSTIRKSIKKMQSIEKMMADGTFENITKKERLQLERERAKLEKVLGGIAQLGRLPAAIFLVDITHEHIALAEAKRLNIPTFGMVDTNSDPTTVDFAIPANDDATKSISIITNFLTEAMIEGLGERKKDKDEAAEGGDESEEGADGHGAFAEVEEGADGEKKKAPRGAGRGGAGKSGGGTRGGTGSGGGRGGSGTGGNRGGGTGAGAGAGRPGGGGGGNRTRK